MSNLEYLNEEVNNFIEILSQGEAPWYLKSVTIYDFLKSSLLALETSDLTQKIDNISKPLLKYVNYSFQLATTYLLHNFDANHFSRENISSLISLIDRNLIILLNNVDSKADDIRQLLATSLKTLKEVLIASYGTVQETSATIKSVCDENISSIGENVQKFHEDASNTVHKFHDDASKTVNDYNQCFQAVGANVLELALLESKLVQPYVHEIVSKSTPLIIRAATYSKPYVSLANYYISPVIKNATEQIKNNTTLAPLLDTAATGAAAVIF